MAPIDEACQALVDRINSGITYILPRPATYTHYVIDALEEVQSLRVDVCPIDAEQLQETLATEDRSSHTVRVILRDRLPDAQPATIATRNQIAYRIFQRLNEYTTPDRRVAVWEAGKSKGEQPGKEVLIKGLFYLAYIELRVEVEPS